MVQRLVLVPLSPGGPVMVEDLAGVELGRGDLVTGILEGTLVKK